MTSRKRLRVGTRGSKLALAQAGIVTRLLSEATEGLEIQVVPVRTRGDIISPSQRGDTDGKGVFTEDIESLLLSGDLDIAVHSMKDLSVKIPAGLIIAASPPRGDPRDALISLGKRTLKALPRGASVGTSSMRREAQLLHLRRDLRVVGLHGNVETRIRRMTEIGIDGVVLAAAGLDRLSLGAMITQRFPVSQLVPAACQGALAVETRKNDQETTKLVSRISDTKTMAVTECEREFAMEMGADCTLPVGAYASFSGRSVTLTGMVASDDGAKVLRRKMTSTDFKGLGARLGKEMLELGGMTILSRGESRA